MYLLQLAFLFLSMSQPNNFPNKKMHGYWTFDKSSPDKEYMTYNKSDTMRSNTKFIFEKGNKLSIRTIKHDGFCGTPPHRYQYNQGTWTLDGIELTLTYTIAQRMPMMHKDGTKRQLTVKEKYEIVYLKQHTMALKRI